MIIHEASWVCPGNGAPIADGAIAIDAGKVTHVGQRSEMPAGEIVRHADAAILPGFVNAHAHLELSIFRGVFDRGPFFQWIRNLVQTKRERLSRDDLKVSAQLGAIEMLQTGVTAVGEVMDAGTGWEAMKEFGLQGVAYQEVFGPVEGAAADSLAELWEKLDAIRPEQTESLRVGISPHAPYTVSKALYGLVSSYARSESLPLTTHIAESGEETLFVKEGAGPFAENHRQRGIDVVARHCLPVAYLHRLGLLGPDMLLVHAIDVIDDEFDRIAGTQSKVVHCPKSNAWFGHSVARVGAMREHGITVALGTDSGASNDSIDMFAEMRAAMWNHPSLTPADVFRMATLDGARALNLEMHIGSLDVGKRADFVVVACPATSDPVSTIVQQASREDVRATFLAGRAADLDDGPISERAAGIRNRLR